MKRGICILSVLIVSVALPVTAGGINSSVHVDSGEVVDGDVSTVNGRVRIEDGAIVRGDAGSVNGSVAVGNDARVEGVSSVNGSVEIGEGTSVDGEVETVNGRISMETGSSAESVATVNGSLELTGADIRDDVTTYNGDVTLRDGTIVGGNILVKESKGTNRRSRALRIRVEDGSTVQGDVIVEDKELDVEVHLSGGTVAGEIRGAEVIRK